MNLPLYKDEQRKPQLPWSEDSHRGLWWSRFFDKYADGFAKPGEGINGEFIKDISKIKCGNEEKLEQVSLRMAALCCDALGGSTNCFKTQGRFATGMGNDHPTENGFTWHPTLGVPYLPASSVKGLVRSWLEWQWGKDALKKNGDEQKRLQLLQWFGSEHKDTKEQLADHQAGWFVFFDALPIAPVQLASDVMTPHYGEWYEKGSGDTPAAADTVPADWHNPNPITFLTVKKATFQFGIAVRGGLSEQHRTDAQTALPSVMEVLQVALEWAGAGAKTATGYGRMTEDKNSDDLLIEQRKQAALVTARQKLSPNLLAIEELRVEIEKRLPNKIAIFDAFWGGRIKKLALEVEQSSAWGADEKCALADMLEEWAGKLMKLDAKDLRKHLKLAALRGHA